MKRILFHFIIFLVITSCEDFGEKIINLKPETAIAESNFWENEEDFAAASREVHTRFRWCFSDVSHRIYRDRGRLFDYQSVSYNNIAQNYLERSWNTGSSNIKWKLEYDIILQANQILNGLEITKGLTKERKKFYRGEALTMRAYAYFYIIRCWGDAPLVLQDFKQGELPRTPWQDIADLIIGDLEEAAKLLPPRSQLKDESGKAVDCNQIPSQGTANAILAEVCAWKGSLNKEPQLLQKGIAAATAVIESGEYELAPDAHSLVMDVLKGNSQEGIWELAFYDINGETSTIGSCMAYACEGYPVIANSLPQTARRIFRLSNEKAKEVFNTCGELFDETFYNFDEMAALPYSTNQGAAYIWKFRITKLYEDGPKVGQTRIFDMNEILIRLAGLILLRAEMYAKIGDEAAAIRDLNRVRERCKAAPYSAKEGDVLEAVFHQMEQELFCEGLSNRYFAIMRNGLDYVHKYLPGRFKEAKGLDELFLPISKYAFGHNTLMEQNRYWNQFPQFKVW